MSASGAARPRRLISKTDFFNNIGALQAMTQ
jgi:hypothetical protein